MDPALFRIDGELLTEVLMAIVVLSIFVERALSIVSEHRLFVSRLDEKGVKEPIAFLVSLGVVYLCKLDAIAIIFKGDTTTLLGYVITAVVVAGGSKGSIKLFHDVFNAKSTALRLKRGK